jgi:hypothetical protein
LQQDAAWPHHVFEDRHGLVQAAHARAGGDGDVARVRAGPNQAVRAVALPGRLQQAQHCVDLVGVPQRLIRTRTVHGLEGCATSGCKPKMTL